MLKPLNVIILGLAIFVSSAQAETMPTPGIFRILIRKAMGGNVLIRPEGLIMLEATSRGMNEKALAGRALSNAGYLLVHASDDRTAAITVRTIVKDSTVFQHIPGDLNPIAKSPGQIEIGISRLVDDKKMIETIKSDILRQGEQNVLNPDNVVFAMRYADQWTEESVEMFASFQDVLLDLGKNPDAAMVQGISRLIANGDGTFSIVRNFRFRADMLNAGEPERLIRSIEALVNQIPH